jgi:hypothetical protein
MITKSWDRLLLRACVASAALALLALPAAAGAKTKTKLRTAQFIQCVSTAVPIPDGPMPPFTSPNPTASFAIPVQVPRFKKRPQDGVVTSFGSVGVRITHTDDSDLALYLVSPGGRAVALATFRDDSSNKDDEGNPSPSGDGFGSGSPNCSGDRVSFGDRYRPSITTPGNTGLDAPILGAFKPEQPLSTFVGGPARGFWTLIVQDVQGQDSGQIDALALSFDYSYKAKAKKKKKKRKRR